MTSGERIKQERELRRLSQENLAEQMEVSRQAVSKWETGQSRPSREKLERLSALFDLPMSVWDEEPPSLSAQIQLKYWKLATALLSVVLCIALAALLFLWPKAPADTENVSPSESSPVEESPQNGPPSQAGTSAEPEAPPSVSHIFPETLALEVQSVDGFGSWPLAEADPEAMAANPVVVFQERFPASSWLQILRANPDVEEHAVFYDVFARYFRTLADAESEIIPLGRLAVGNHYVGSGLTGTESFTNVLGHDGWKISLSIGANYVASWYFCVDPEDGRVYPLLKAADVCAEYDVDEDGVKEIVASSGSGWSSWFIYDLLPDGSCVCYELKQSVYGVMRLTFSPEEGFRVADDSGTVLVRYILRDGAMLRQQPLDFSAEDYPDAVGITLSFVTDPARSDGRDPDAVLDNGTTRTTHRQQAMLALQMLYDLTGRKPTECVCIANPDQISFYTAEDGEPGTLFYQWMPGKQYGGQDWVSGITLHWQEEYPGSPLTFSPSPIRLSAGHTPEEWLRSYALTLPLLCRDSIVYISKDPSGWPHHYALYRSDGTYYSARLLDTETGFALAHFYGPCAAGAP